MMTTHHTHIDQILTRFGLKKEHKNYYKGEYQNREVKVYCHAQNTHRKVHILGGMFNRSYDGHMFEFVVPTSIKTTFDISESGKTEPIVLNGMKSEFIDHEEVDPEGKLGLLAMDPKWFRQALDTDSGKNLVQWLIDGPSGSLSVIRLFPGYLVIYAKLFSSKLSTQIVREVFENMTRFLEAAEALPKPEHTLKLGKVDELLFGDRSSFRMQAYLIVGVLFFIVFAIIMLAIYLILEFGT